ncbi:MAG: nickel pincer cofactor biosynthesis protein LarC [Clostridia bacterium]|nr:nickel pincer cofactor biosynthesis protein LarC [Clostridia bacterium]
MKILYFDCGMGAAGDMLCASLLDLLEKPEDFVGEFNAIGIPGVEMSLENAESCSVRGRRVHIRVNGQEEHSQNRENGQHGKYLGQQRSLGEVLHIIDALPLSETVRRNASETYRALAEAEAKIHNMAPCEVHFHELGSLDALADITAFCLLLEKLAPDEIQASAIHVGSGQLTCAHGLMPVPAPATAELLRGIPSYGGEIKGELCTPTGAALLKHFVKKFGAQPLMAVSAVGYGLGTKEFSAPNCVRAFLGEAASNSEAVEEICCNLDDMTGEAIGFALERLLENGALDAYYIPIGMKKSRPGVMLCCLCKPEDTEKLSELMLRHTSSLGVRVTGFRRTVLERKTEEIATPYGRVRIKTAGGVSKPEYEDLALIARENDLTLGEAAKLIDRQ